MIFQILMTAFDSFLTQVPLNVKLKNEIKHKDMVNIMTHLQQYVPMNAQKSTM